MKTKSNNQNAKRPLDELIKMDTEALLKETSAQGFIAVKKVK